MGVNPFMGPIKVSWHQSLLNKCAADFTQLPNMAPQYHDHGRHYYGASEEALMFVYVRECIIRLPRVWRRVRRM